MAEIADHAHREGQGGPLLGYLDEDPERHGLDVLGFPVLGGLEWWETRKSEVDLVIAIGDDEVRCRLVGQLGPQASYATLISPLAHLSRHCSIGEGTVIFPRAVVSNQVLIGRHVILGTASSVSHDGKVGDYCSLFPGAMMTGGVFLGDHVMLGANSSVIPGKTIGSGSKVGAGACVVTHLPSGITAVGVPARPRS